MKLRLVGCLVFLVLSGMTEVANASTTLYLPRQFEVAEMGTVGVALMNPTLTTANLTYKLLSAQGALITTSTGTLGPKGQMAQTLNQIFPNATAAGTFSVDIDVEQVTGLWMYGDFVNSTDGARLLGVNDAIAGPAYTFLSSSSEISFMNLGTTTLSGNLLLLNASGTTVATFPFQLISQGTFQRTVASLFPTQAINLNTAGYWIGFNTGATSSKIIGTSVTPSPGKDNIAANAASTSTATGVFPYVIAGQFGSTNYDGLLTLTNFRTSADVTLTLRQSSGAVLTVQRTIPQNGVLRTSITSLFGVPTVDGWVQVDGGAGSLAGFVSYTDTGTGGSTAVEMQSSSSGSDSSLIFGHIANVYPWQTGIALANPSSTSGAQVEVYAFDQTGKLITGPEQSAAASFVLPAQSKTAFLIESLLPDLLSRTADGGYILIRTLNGVQINGIELFFLRSGRVYSNVPATRVTRLGLAFTPASVAGGGGSGTVTMEQAYIGDSANRAITNVDPCSAITLNIQVNNTTGRTVSVTREYRATGPNGYSLYMASFPRDQVAGRTTAYSALTVPCDAPAGTYRFTATVDYNGILSSTSGTTTVTTGAGSGGTGGTGGTGGNCIPSSTTICILAVDYDGWPMMDIPMPCVDRDSGARTFSAFMMLAQGGSPLSGYTWSLASGSTLPAGVALEPLTGILKGTGTQVLPGTFTLQASDGTRVGTRTFTMGREQVAVSNVFDPGFTGPCPTADFQQPQSQNVILPNAPAGKAYGASLEAVLGRPGTLTWSVDNSLLPAGLALDQSRGVIRGTPFSSASGRTYRFQVSVRTSNPATGQPPEASCGGFGCPTYVITVP